MGKIANFFLGPQKCPRCHGPGTIKCKYCGGKGAMGFPTKVTCKKCKGTGELQCPNCKGKGEIKR